MINVTPRLLSKIIRAAKKQNRDTKKFEDVRSNMIKTNSHTWTSRKCNSFDEIEKIFDEHKIVRPWTGK